MKTVVYGATKNIYRDTIPSIRSCLKHGNADEIVLLTEGKYPYDLPIKTMDVSGQTFFPKDGINATKRWTWMALMKTAMTELFPDRDRIVFLDCDTIVEHALDDLFEMKLYDYYAMVSAEAWMEYGGYAAQKMLHPAENSHPQRLRPKNNRDNKRIEVLW